MLLPCILDINRVRHDVSFLQLAPLGLRGVGVGSRSGYPATYGKFFETHTGVRTHFKQCLSETLIGCKKNLHKGSVVVSLRDACGLHGATSRDTTHAVIASADDQRHRPFVCPRGNFGFMHLSFC